MRRRVRFKGMKITPKTLEKELIDKARRLADDPSLLMPECQKPCKKCNFDKLLDKMEKMSRFKGDPDRLISLAGWGDQLVRAYAATISLAAAGQIPYLAVMKLPVGDVSYAVRGKVEKEKLIGVQYFDDPDLRLLAFWDIARRDDLHLYSSTNKFSCSSEGPSAPAEYVEEMLDSAPYKIGNECTCGHPASTTKLTITWKSTGKTISVCRDCLTDENLLHHLSSGIAARDPTDDFEVGVEYSLECRSDCQGCPVEEDFRMSAALKERYASGQIGDRALADGFVEERTSDLRRSNRTILVVGQDCYGSEIDSFLSRIRGTDAEKKALRGLLETKDVAIVSGSDQAGKILADLWTGHSRALLEQVASKVVVDSILKQQPNLAPSQLILEAARLESAKGIHSSLPTYSKLGEVGRYADRMARIYKTEGRAAVARAIEKERQLDHRMRAVSYAFLTLAGEADAKSWQFSKEEKDFGTYLSQFAIRLAEGEGDEYNEALEVLVMASGSIEEIVRAK